MYKVDKKNVGSIGAVDLALFLRRSNLSDVELGKMWDIFDIARQGSLDKIKFFLMLKCIALAQAGEDVNMSTLYFKTPPPKMQPICRVCLFSPFKYMLAERYDVRQVETLMKEVSYYLETTPEGERFQLHMKNGIFRYYSSDGKDCSCTFGINFSAGALTDKLAGCFKPNVLSCILDGEMKVWNEDLRSFGTKGQNFDVQILKPGGVYHPYFSAFDVLLLNDRVLTNKPLQERMSILENVFTPIESVMVYSKRWKISSKREVLDALNMAIDNREEGIILKDPQSVYNPNLGKGGWIEFKPEYTDELLKHLDLLIVGGYFSGGKEIQIVSHFLLAVAVPPSESDEEPSEFHSIARVGSRYWLEELGELLTKLQPHWHPVKNGECPKAIIWTKEKPDFWISPENSHILEVKATEIIEGDWYKTGYTLRFPRVNKVRYDRSWKDCLSTEEFAQLRQHSSGKPYPQSVDDNKSESRSKRRKVICTTQTIEAGNQFQEVDVPAAEQLKCCGANTPSDLAGSVSSGGNQDSAMDVLVRTSADIYKVPQSCCVDEDQCKDPVKTKVCANSLSAVHKELDTKMVEKEKNSTNKTPLQNRSRKAKFIHSFGNKLHEEKRQKRKDLQQQQQQQPPKIRPGPSSAGVTVPIGPGIQASPVPAGLRSQSPENNNPENEGVQKKGERRKRRKLKKNMKKNPGTQSSNKGKNTGGAATENKHRSSSIMSSDSAVLDKEVGPISFIRHMRIRRNERGLSYQFVFGDYFKKCEKIILVDPYVNNKLQVLLLRDLIKTAISMSDVFRQIYIVTKKVVSGGNFNRNTQFFNQTIVTNYFKLQGVDVSFNFARELHDRLLHTSTGYVIYMGRGIDFFKTSSSLSKTKVTKGCNLFIFRETQFKDDLPDMEVLQGLLKATDCKLRTLLEFGNLAQMICKTLSLQLNELCLKNDDGWNNLKKHLKAWENTYISFKTEACNWKEMAAQSYMVLFDKLQENKQGKYQLESNVNLMHDCQGEVADLKRQLVQSRAAMQAAVKEKEEVVKRMQGQINCLSQSLGQSQLRNNELQGQVTIFKTSYANVFPGKTPPQPASSPKPPGDCTY